MTIGVAMSGGVDSSAAACLLLEQGHDIVGFTMRHFDDAQYGFGPEEGVEADIRDAADVCRQLDVAHYVIDVRAQFENIVVRDFIGEYEQGRTPNPCCLCNPAIKWGVLLNALLAQGATTMATGHYALLARHDDKVRLYRGERPERDQSYMLWALDQRQLRHTLFPIAHLDKQAARDVCQRHHLRVHVKSDSQDICFVRGDYRDILGAQDEPGDVVFKDGRVIGKHLGVWRHTIGQRRGLGIPWNTPLYVVDIDPAGGVITVTDDPADLERDSFAITRTNWIAGEPPEVHELGVQVRYNSSPAPVKALTESDGDWIVTLRQPERAITPGQSAVFYRGDEVLGGGVITR